MFLHKSGVINYNMGDEYILVNSMQGSFHQGNVEKIEDTAGRQWAYMALFAIAYNHFHNILRLFDILPNFAFTTSEIMRDYYL